MAIRSLLLSFILLFAACSGSYAIIGVGYSYKNVLFWRFWEIKDGKPVPEILVYNTSDSAIDFTIRKVFVVDMAIDSLRHRWYDEQSAKYAKDTIIKTVAVPPHQYGVFVIGRETIKGGYDGAFVNGAWAGIANHDMRLPDAPPDGQYEYKYYSYEGMYASCTIGLIAKNKLINKRGATENMVVLFDFPVNDNKHAFPGITDFSAEIKAGLDKATVSLSQNEYVLNTDKKTVKFPANMHKGEKYRMDISLKVAGANNQPYLDLREFFQNGNQVTRLPVFVQ